MSKSQKSWEREEQQSVVEKGRHDTDSGGRLRRNWHLTGKAGRDAPTKKKLKKKDKRRTLRIMENSSKTATDEYMQRETSDRQGM